MIDSSDVVRLIEALDRQTAMQAQVLEYMRSRDAAAEEAAQRRHGEVLENWKAQERRRNADDAQARAMSAQYTERLITAMEAKP